MADALPTMLAPLQVLAFQRRGRDPDGPLSPESRAPLGQAEAVIWHHPLYALALSGTLEEMGRDSEGLPEPLLAKEPQ